MKNAVRLSAVVSGRKIVLLASFLLLHPVAAKSQNFPSAPGVVPPEIVQFEHVRVDAEMKIVTVGNEKRSYSLFCNPKLDSCITPEPNKNYLLFNKDTRCARLHRLHRDEALNVSPELAAIFGRSMSGVSLVFPIELLLVV